MTGQLESDYVQITLSNRLNLTQKKFQPTLCNVSGQPDHSCKPLAVTRLFTYTNQTFERWSPGQFSMLNEHNRSNIHDVHIR